MKTRRNSIFTHAKISPRDWISPQKEYRVADSMPKAASGRNSLQTTVSARSLPVNSLSNHFSDVWGSH